MTVHIDWDQQQVKLQVDGDIYEEQAACICDMVESQIQKGVKELNIQFDSAYYISRDGYLRLQNLQKSMRNSGVRLKLL